MQRRASFIGIILVGISIALWNSRATRALAADENYSGPAANLIAGSVWQGVQHSVSRPNDSQQGANLTIISRSGSAVKAEFWVNDRKHGRRGVKAQGTLGTGDGSLVLRPYEIISGEWQAPNLLNETWNCSVNGQSLSFLRHAPGLIVRVDLTLKTDN